MVEGVVDVAVQGEKAAGAIANLGDALQDIGINTASGNLDLDNQWDGNASEAAYVYFTQLGATLSEQRQSLTGLAESYQKAAEGTFRIAESFSGILKIWVTPPSWG
ncbi:WXG100 family type VII secretion target [Actinoplanes sp. NPDC051859]|uniref:WXG100 family type VII secretion target n=1 Tax=Actinoplanes sp. NPDC051859 TaxID=3363909 RepID=UPI003787BEAF